MDIKDLLDRLAFLAQELEKESILPFPSHVVLTKIAIEIAAIQRKLKKEIW